MADVIELLQLPMTVMLSAVHEQCAYPTQPPPPPLSSAASHHHVLTMIAHFVM